jgi:hypothetical protein
MPTDPKWRVIAKKSGRPLSEVLSVFMLLMTNASANATERGRTQRWSHEDAAAALDMQTEDVKAIYDAMQGKVLDGEQLTGWEKRQPKREDSSAERAKAWRERNRTQPNAEERPDPYPDSKCSTSLPLEQEAPREEVEKLVSAGMGRGGEVSTEARRKVAAKLAIGNADPLVALYHGWQRSKAARDPDALFIRTAERFWRDASPEVRAACQPQAPPPPEPIAMRPVRPSSSLMGSPLASRGRHAH